MSVNNIRFYEELSSNGHVALNLMQYDGWLLRFSNGYTARANSVSVIYPSTLPLEEKISYCEECYQKQGLPCQFKITDSESDKALNEALKNRGYEPVNTTDILVQNLDSYNFPVTENAAFFVTPTEEWLSAYFPFENITDQNNINTFRQMLAKVQVKTIFAAIIDDGKIAACASAAIEHGYMLLHNVVVSPEKRGKGFGKQVCQSLIAKAKSEGTENAFLQVVRTNEVAYNLYKKLGFKKEYSYWYMRKNDF